MTMAGLMRVSVLALAAFSAAGCRERDEAAAAGPAQIDTTNEEWEDGLSSEQVEAQAEAMTPEQAAALGIIDTTIHVENLSEDTTLPAPAVGPSPARSDTVRRPAAPRDTARP